MEGRKHFRMRLTIEVDLVENNGHRDVIYFACHKDTVQKRQFDFGIVDCGYDERTVKVGRYDMRLARKIGGLADYIVLARMNGSYGSRIFQSHMLDAGTRTIFKPDLAVFPQIRDISFESHHISHRNRIGRRRTLETDLASQDCRKQVPVRKLSQKIMASRMLDYCCFAFHHQIFLNQASVHIFSDSCTHAISFRGKWSFFTTVGTYNHNFLYRRFPETYSCSVAKIMK